MRIVIIQLIALILPLFPVWGKAQTPVPKLPAPKEEDLSRGILETVDIESYRAEKRATMKFILEDADAEIEPVPTAGGGYHAEPEFKRWLTEKVFDLTYEQQL